MIQQSQLFSQTHSADKCHNFNLFSMLTWYDCLKMIFNLNSKFTSRAHNQPFYFADLIVRIFFKMSNQNVQHWNAKAKGFTLASPSCDDHINM